MSMHSYTTVQEVRRIKPIPDAPASLYESVVEVATEAIDDICGRRFDTDVDTRDFEVELDYLSGRYASMDIDDIVPGSDTPVQVELLSDPEADGTVQTEGWWLAPRTPKVGWPHTELTVRSQYQWEGRMVRITAEFGWPAVPAVVSRACLMLAARILERENSILGLQTNNEFGTQIVPARFDPDTARLLRDYKKHRLIGRWE